MEGCAIPVKKEKPLRAKTPFGWFGGKTYATTWLLPIIAKTPHVCFVDVFGGSGTVLWNKSPSPVEVYNDLHSEVVNFFRVLREQPDKLIEQLNLTPYSREEYKACLNCAEEPIDRARAFFVVARQVSRGLATTASEGRWCYVRSESRKGKSLVVSRWLGAIEYLEELVERIRYVTIENLDYKDILSRYDTPDTLFYLDPPYLPEVRPGGTAYKHEFNAANHEEMLDLITKLKGKVLLSGYENKLYSDKLVAWEKFEAEPKCINSANFQKARVCQEVLWIK